MDSRSTTFQSRTTRWSLTDVGVAFDFVGSRSGPHAGGKYGCPHDFDQDHEGHWGASIEDAGLAAMSKVQRLQPDVALVHLGTNDIYASMPPSEAATVLESLVSELQAAQPAMTVLVAQIIPCVQVPLCFSEEIGPVFHEAVAPLADLSTDESTVIVVDMFTDFDRNDLRDSYHPDDAGDEFIAKRWMDALELAGLIDLS